MALSPLAGKPAPKEMLIDPARLDGNTTPASPTQPSRQQITSHERTPGLCAHGVVQRSAHPGHHAGDLRLPARARHHRPLYMAETRTLFPVRPAHCARVLAANGVETVYSGRQRRDANSGDFAANLVHNRGRTDRLADACHHPSIILRRTADSSTTRLTATGRERRNELDSGARKRAAARG